MEGQRVDKSGGGSKLPWIITGTITGILAAVYLGACAWAAGRNTILPNVSVAGLNVSGMTEEQALTVLEDAVAQQGGDVTLTLTYGEIEESLNGADVAADTAESVRAARQIGHGNFFAGGPRLVGHLLGASAQLPLALAENEPAQADLIDRMDRAVNAATDNHGYWIEGDELMMTKGAPVTTINWSKEKANIEEELQRAFRTRFSGERDKVEVTIGLSASQSLAQEPDFDAIHQELYVEPKDASLDLESMEITDHAVGIDFDTGELRSAYRAAESGKTFSIPITVTRPKVTKEDLGGQLFKDLLGEGTTRVSGSANRKHNVKLSAEACNEKILLPGEEFSYNNTTGSRTADKGYKNAPIYQQGQSVDDIGGGICQTSSTIYYAVLHTNLEVVERHCHQFNTGYVDPGMDATVFFGSLDFRFKNSTDYPVKIVTNSYDANGNRYLNVKIYGTNPEGIYAEPKSSTFDRVVPTTAYVPDPSVPQGTLVKDRQQNPYTGISAHTYRYVYDKDGNQIDKQDMGGSKYKMRPTTYHYNPADGDPSTWVNGQPGTTTPTTPTNPTTPENPTTPTDPDTSPTDPGTTTPTDPGPQPPANPDTAPPSEAETPPATPGTDPADPGQMAG